MVVWAIVNDTHQDYTCKKRKERFVSLDHQWEGPINTKIQSTWKTFLQRERERRQTFFTYGIICHMRSKPRAHDKLRKRTKKSTPNET